MKRFQISILLIGTVGLNLMAQSEPKLISVKPPEGASGVSTNSTVVMVFDQDMDTSIRPFPSLPPLLIGNFAFEPTNLFFNGTWATDKRTLTFKVTGKLPYDTTISWTLNPPGPSAFPPLASALHQVLPTVSGSFRTEVYVPPPAPPKLISVTPTNNAIDVSPESSVVFVFDQAMDATIALQASVAPSVIGNYDFKPANITSLFHGSWSADQRTLTFRPDSALPPATTVFWTLNPGGTPVPLKGTNGLPLAVATGNYRVLAVTGNPTDPCARANTGLGFYSVMKTLAYRQTSARTVIPDSDAPATFVALAQSPSASRRSIAGSADTITNASITLPTGVTEVLTDLTNRFFLYDLASSESALEAAYAPGHYTLRLDQIQEPEGIVAMEMPATPASIPEILNYVQAQNIDLGQRFSLEWKQLQPQSPGAFISLTITDASGRLVFQAPNLCESIALAPTDTSVFIPPASLQPNQTYTGVLQFGVNFYSATNDIPKMVGYGAVARSTTFTLMTTQSVVVPNAVSFTSFRLLANQHPELSLTGQAGQQYRILRTGALTQPIWTQVGVVTLNPSGVAVFEDADVNLTFPAFYRAEQSGISK